MQPKLKCKRNQKASSFVELAAGLIAIVPIFLTLFDLAMIVNVVQINDSAAREAAWVAAAGDPLAAQTRAQTVVDHANAQSKAMSSQFTLKSVIFNPTTLLTDEAAMVPYGGTLNGQVTVTTEVVIQPYVIALINNNQPLTFDSKKTVPFTFNVPNTAGGIAPLP